MWPLGRRRRLRIRHRDRRRPFLRRTPRHRWDEASAEENAVHVDRLCWKSRRRRRCSDASLRLLRDVLCPKYRLPSLRARRSLLQQRRQLLVRPRLVDKRRRSVHVPRLFSLFRPNHMPLSPFLFSPLCSQSLPCPALQCLLHRSLNLRLPRQRRRRRSPRNRLRKRCRPSLLHSIGLYRRARGSIRRLRRQKCRARGALH